MRVELKQFSATLIREDGDKKLYSERAVSYAMIQTLKAQGVEVKRTRGPQGLTACPSASILKVPARKGVESESMLWHERYAVECSYDAYNRGSVSFQRVWV